MNTRSYISVKVIHIFLCFTLCAAAQCLIIKKTFQEYVWERVEVTYIQNINIDMAAKKRKAAKKAAKKTTKRKSAKKGAKKGRKAAKRRI